ncbi:hypothetical protein LXA43DRAFT_89571 [Ganoderma leucocontextum]|nr:hypothetical protein LXA43DRAFT_89571 [Ganoderma leucocontextum]
MLQLQLAQSASSAYASSMSLASHVTNPVTPFAPGARPHRFSSSQQDKDSSRRLSRLPDLLTRKRTASLPPKKEKAGAQGACLFSLPFLHFPSERP